MANISIDGSLCTGCGLCASNCPDCFEIGDDNVARVIAGKAMSPEAKDMADQCPVSAINVQ
ncbi:MAG: ferredoxin [Candidatus Omnitrophota bacterium]